MTHRQLQSLPAEIAQPLVQLERKVRLLAVLRGVAWLVTLLIVGIGAGLLLDLWLGLGESARVALLAALSVAVLGVILGGIVRPLVRSNGPAEMAAVIESAHPELNERLTSTVELLRSDDPESHKGSRLMRQLLLQETTETVRGADLGDAVDGARAQRAGWVAVAAMFLMVLPLFYSRDGYLLLLTRFFNPWSNLERASNLYFVVDDGDRTVARGTDVSILAEPRWRLGEQTLPSEVWLNWTNTGGEADQRRMLWDADQKLYTATLPHVFHAFDFHVESGPAKTREYHINVVEPPSIAAFVVDVQPPAYTGLPAQRLDGAVGETTVFERSKVRFELTFNKPVAMANVEWTGMEAKPAAEQAATSLTLAPDRKSGLLEFDAAPEQAGRFALRVIDEHGLTNADEPLRALRVQLDQAPAIAFADVLDAPEARPNDVIILPVTSSDDIAVHELDLHYSVVPQGGRNTAAAEGRLLGVKQVDYSFKLDLAKLTTDLGAEFKLQNNDRLRIRVRAADERPVPGPNESWTDERTITIRNDAEPYGFEAIAQTREQWREMLQSIREELEQNRREVRDLEQEATADAQQQANFDQNEALAPLAAQQREQATRLEQLAALLATSPLFGNLTESAQGVAEEELVAAPQALDAAAAAETPQKPEQLQASAKQLDSAIEKLGALEQGFEKIADLERDLAEIQRLAERAQNLAEDAVALDEARTNPPADLPPEREQSRQAELERERQELAAEHEDLQGDLSDLLERRPEILDAAREQQFDRLRELARQALELAQPQDQLAEQFQQEAQQQAGSLQGLAQKQRELMQQERLLAGATEPHQAEQVVTPLDLDALRAALEPLQQGDVEAAALKQEQAAAELARLAEELRKNELLPIEPQAAARALAEREQALKTEIEQATQAHQQAREAIKQSQDDAAAQERLDSVEQELRNLAAAQTALQSAIAHLDVPPNDANRRKSTAERAFETVEQLLDERPERAVQTAEQTRQALESLANEIGDDERRRREAIGEARRLREQQEQLAREAADIAKRASEGQPADQTQQQLDQLLPREQKLAEDLTQLDVPRPFEHQQEKALAETADAAADMAAKQPQESAASAREAAQTLADLEQQLDQKPSAGESLAQMLPREAAITEQLASPDSPPAPEALRQSANQQREMSRQLGDLRAPLLEQPRDEARRQLDEAARSAEEAAGGDAEKLAQAQRENAEAQAAMQQFAQQVAGREDAPATPAAQQELANAFQPDPAPLQQLTQQAEQLAQRQADLRGQTEELTRQQASAAAEQAAAAKQPADPNLSREQVKQQQREREQKARETKQQQDQRANELRQQQEQLGREIDQLPRTAAPLAAAQARESADDARDALNNRDAAGNRDAAAAAEAQEQAEQALRDLAAATQGRIVAEQQAATQAAQETMQSAASPAAAAPPADNEPAAPANNPQSEQLAAQAEGLAAEHRQLAEAIRNMRQQQLAQNSSPASQPPAASSPEGQPAPTEPSAPAPNVNQPPAAPAQQTQAALAAQQQLAQEAAELAVATADQTGTESESTMAALRTAEQTVAAARAAAAGQLPQSAEQAGQATQSARQTAEQLQTAGPETPEAALAEQAADLAQRQQALAAELQQLAGSPAARNAAQSQAQEQMAAQAADLAEQFQSVAENLAAQPLDRPQQGQQAEGAQSASRQASQDIESSAGDLSAGNPQQAATQAQQGAQNLRDAAEQALQAAGAMPAEPSQVPQSVGQQLSQAMQQLQAAGDQLAQMPQPASGQPASQGQPQQASAGQQPGAMQSPQQPGEAPTGDAPQTADASQSGQPMPGEAGPVQPGEPLAGMGESHPGEGEPSGQPGQPGMQPPGATQNLQQVAQSLNQAAEQLGLTPGQAQGQRANSQQAQAAGSPTMDGESSDTGAQETVRLTDLDVQLRNISARNWGELPGKLQTQILQSSQQRTGGDYGQVIQRYFEEVSRSRGAAPTTAP